MLSDRATMLNEPRPLPDGTPRAKRRFIPSERLVYFIFTFILTLGSVWFGALTEHRSFGWSELFVGSLAGIVLGCVVAVASEWLRDLVLWLFFP
jgi:hypothetical protein